MSDQAKMSHYANQLKTIYPLTAQAVEQAVGALNPKSGSVGLDAGCGIGHNVIRLAQKAGESTRIVGLDASSEFLDIAKSLAREAGVAERCQFVKGDVYDLAMNDNSFDWLWCKDTLWPNTPQHGASGKDAIGALKDFYRVIKPGGKAALLFWTTQLILPGYPALEARLGVGLANSIPYLKVKNPRQHVMCATGWLREAGFINVRAHCFSSCAYAPLDETMKEAVHQTLHMFYDDIAEHVSEDDWLAVSNLMDENSPDYIIARPDYHGLITYSMFCGDVPA